MTAKTKNINIKLLVVLVIIALAIFSVVYYTSHREITDAHVLSLRAIEASKDTDSYCFTDDKRRRMRGLPK
jgi:flagellar basal body-associated protein FliL